MRKFLNCISCHLDPRTDFKPTIQSLPDGILQTIFSQLDFTSRKAATLVCHRWNQLAFHPDEVILTIDLYPFTHRKRFREATFRRHLLASRRDYRNLDLIVCRRDFVVEILRKFFHCLEFLRLQCRFEQRDEGKVLDLCSNLVALDISNSIFMWDFVEKVEVKSMGNLKRLSANYSFKCISGDDFRIIFPNLDELTVRYGMREEDLRYYGPNLTKLEVIDRIPNDDPIWDVEFPRLEHFKLHADFYHSSSTESAKVECFLSRCGDLKTLSLKRVTGSPDFIQNLTLISPNLVELTLETYCKFSKSACDNFWHYVLTFQQLEKICIQFGEVILTIPPITNILPKMTSLHHLALRSYKASSVASFNQFLEYAFPALKSLEIMSCPEIISPDDIPFANLKNLQTLHLIDRSDALQNLTPQQPWRSLHWKFLSKLQLLPNLRELVIDFQQFEFENTPQELPQIRTLASNCGITREQWIGLGKMMPNLTRVKLVYRDFKIVNDNRANETMARKVFPNCELESYCRCRKPYELPRDGRWIFRDCLKVQNAHCEMY